MVKNYIIAIGGSGSRCLAATVYLSAAGLFDNHLHVTIIDPDQTNGNAEQTRKLISSYHALNSCEQPARPRDRRFFVKRSLAAPAIFRPSINRKEESRDQYGYFWQDPNSPDRTFGDSVDYVDAPDPIKNFAKLFYEREDLEMPLGKGYRGRPNVGAVTLISDLRRTSANPNSALGQMMGSIRADLQAERPVRVFVYGSVFGGTGAAGIPSVPRLAQDSISESHTTHHEKMRFGVAMLTPYFTFPAGTAVGGPAPNSSLQQVATQAALLHYGHNDPGYQHVYVVGAPEMASTNMNYSVGGESQENDPHYVEILASMGARDFFKRVDFPRNQRSMHYVDGDHVGWRTLPCHSEQDQKEVKRKLIAFGTFCFVYTHLLHEAMSDAAWLKRQAWYFDNFIKRGYTLETSTDALNSLNQFCDGFLNWLEKVGRPLQEDPKPLFNWSALATGQRAETLTGQLSSGDSKYPKTGYGHIMDRLSRLTPTFDGDVTPMGLFVYLLYEAVGEFCDENYGLS